MLRNLLRIDGRSGSRRTLLQYPKPLSKGLSPAVFGRLQRFCGSPLFQKKVYVIVVKLRRIGHEGELKLLMLERRTGCFKRIEGSAVDFLCVGETMFSFV